MLKSEELAQKQRELKAAWEKSDATVRVAASLEQAKEAAEAEKKKACPPCPDPDPMPRGPCHYQQAPYRGGVDV